MKDIKTDGGKNMWLAKGNNYVLILGSYFLSKHGEDKAVAGGTIKGWKTLDDIYAFYRDTDFAFRPGFQSIKAEAGKNMDTVSELSSSEVKSLMPKDLGLAPKNNFEIPNLPPNMAPILRGHHIKGKSQPTNVFQMLMFPTTKKDLDADTDLGAGYEEAKKVAGELEEKNYKLWIVLTTYPGKAAAPGNKPGKEDWIHPNDNGEIEGKFAFTEDSVSGKVEPWPQNKTVKASEEIDWVGQYLA